MAKECQVERIIRAKDGKIGERNSEGPPASWNIAPSQQAPLPVPGRSFPVTPSDSAARHANAAGLDPLLWRSAREDRVMTDRGYATANLSTALSEIARTLQAEPDVESTLAAIVKAAVDHVDDAEHAGISLVEKGGRLRTVAATSEVVRTIDEIQHRTNQGPDLDAIAEQQVYRTGDLTAEDRWPTFSPEAARTGIRSLLAYRLFVNDTTLGSLNLYSHMRNAFSDQTEAEGTLFATHAAIALAGAQTEAQLHTAAESRDIIGMAKGILMQRHGLDPVEAFQMLVESSQQTNTKLHQVATWLVEHHHEL
jgi:transcriptional regulator with GAF, ATPase, and Fis domain